MARCKGRIEPNGYRLVTAPGHEIALWLEVGKKTPERIPQSMYIGPSSSPLIDHVPSPTNT
jgi:hypothetical protein